MGETTNEGLSTFHDTVKGLEIDTEKQQVLSSIESVILDSNLPTELKTQLIKRVDDYAEMNDIMNSAKTINELPQLIYETTEQLSSADETDAEEIKKQATILVQEVLKKFFPVKDLGAENQG